MATFLPYLIFFFKFLGFNFDCLGHWDGPDDQNYVIVLDNRHNKQNLPKYRCGVSIEINRFSINVQLYL